jgi:hypothetical protein
MFEETKCEEGIEGEIESNCSGTAKTDLTSEVWCKVGTEEGAGCNVAGRWLDTRPRLLAKWDGSDGSL